MGQVAKVQLPVGARVVVGKLLQQIKSGFKKRDCLDHRAARFALLDGKQTIFHRFSRIAAAGVMMGQRGEMIVQVLAIDQFHAGADSFMQQPPAFVENRVVSYVMGKRVLKRVLDVSYRRLLVDELT